MSEIGQLNTQAAKQDPERFFQSPLRLVDEIMLTRGEKLATLERWRLNILQELDAAYEGMHTRGTSAKHAVVLREIEEAEKLLK